MMGPWDWVVLAIVLEATGIRADIDTVTDKIGDRPHWPQTRRAGHDLSVKVRVPRRGRALIRARWSTSTWMCAVPRAEWGVAVDWMLEHPGPPPRRPR